jgi:hypothetical protein
MMAVEPCGASPAFAHPYTNEEQDHASRSPRRGDEVVLGNLPVGTTLRTGLGG